MSRTWRLLLGLAMPGVVPMAGFMDASTFAAQRKLFVVGDSISIAYGPSL